jgi:outer membrane lipoprotein-sorting protein
MNTYRSGIIMLLLSLCCIPGLFAQDAKEIIEKMDKVLYGADNQYSEVRMTLTDRNGNERIREARIWQKGDDKRLFRFTAPAAEAGIAFLSLPDEVMYLYLPAFGRERRIASHVKNQSFAGTDFSYEDLESKAYAKRYTASLQEQSETCYRIALIPLPENRSDYSRIEVKVDKEHYFPMVMESYDRGGNKVKVAMYTFAKEGAYWYPQEITIDDLKKNHTTRMEMTHTEFDTEMDEQIFSIRNISRY